MDYFDEDSDNDFEVCPYRSNCGQIPTLVFDTSSIENVILQICDKFDFRVIMSDERAKGALMVTTGLAIAGGFIGKHYGGKVGMAVGGAIGGACGLGIAVVAMREIWQDVKEKLYELYEIVYDYLAGMGIEDYRSAGTFLMQNVNNGGITQLAMLILQTASSILGKKILSNLVTA